MSNLHLRGLDEHTIQKLKHLAMQQKISVNALILNLISQSLGITNRPRTVVYHDLDKFSGTWTVNEAKAFMEDVSSFEKIDKDLWK